jgi:hypothetical protein
MFSHSAKQGNFPHLMSKDEIALLQYYLRKVSKYTEFGSGASTCDALSFKNILSIHSVEYDLLWFEKMHDIESIKTGISSGRLSLHYADIGATRKSYPAHSWHTHKWPYCFWGIWKYIQNDADFILIDGRFRVATAFMALVFNKKNYWTFAIHDFPDRKHYHIVKKYSTEIETSGTLSIFMPNKYINMQELLLDLYDYIFLPDDHVNSRCIARLYDKPINHLWEYFIDKAIKLHDATLLKKRRALKR